MVLPCAELLADVPVAAALAGAGDDQITHAGQAGEGVTVAADRLAELATSPAAPGPSPSRGCCPRCRASRPSRRRWRRRSSAHRRSRRRPRRRSCRSENAWCGTAFPVGGQVLIGHGEHRGGGVAVGDLARDVRARPGCPPGVRAAPRRRSGSCARFVPCSRPFTSDTTGTHGRSSLASCSSTPRKPCDGTPMTTTSAQSAASLKSVVARRVSDSVDLVAEVLRVAVVVVDVGGRLLRAHPLQRRSAPRADGCDGGSPGAATEDDDLGFALSRCHGISVLPTCAVSLAVEKLRGSRSRR